MYHKKYYHGTKSRILRKHLTLIDYKTSELFIKLLNIHINSLKENTHF